MSKTIGILGCGWLGLPLAKALVERNYHVKGTTTNPDKIEILRNSGIIPFLVELQEDKIEGEIETFLEELPILIIDIPPKLRSAKAGNFVSKITLLLDRIKKSDVANVLFVSSTSVYGDQDGEITETSEAKPKTTSGIQLLEVETLLKNAPHLKTTIVRFGGLIGPKRHPVTTLSGRKDLSNGNAPVNLIHLNDAVHMLVTILENGYWGEVFNGVYPDHPSKQDYYTSEAKKRGLSPPKYRPAKDKIQGKIVKSKNFLDKKHAFLTPIRS